MNMHNSFKNQITQHSLKIFREINWFRNFWLIFHLKSACYCLAVAQILIFIGFEHKRCQKKCWRFQLFSPFCVRKQRTQRPLFFSSSIIARTLIRREKNKRNLKSLLTKRSEQTFLEPFRCTFLFDFTSIWRKILFWFGNQLLRACQTGTIFPSNYWDLLLRPYHNFSWEHFWPMPSCGHA